MNPALLEMAMLKQQKEAGQQANPINSGSEIGLEAAKQSLEMDEVQRKRALGRALISYFSNVVKPGYGQGLSGALSAAAQSMQPALSTYQGEEERAMRLNAALLQRQDALEKDRRREEIQRSRDEESRGLRERQLRLHERAYEEMTPYQREHLELMKGRQSKEEREREHWENIQKDLEPGVEPIEKFRSKPSEWTHVMKRIDSARDQTKYAKQGMKIISRLNEIMQESPELYNSYGNILMNSHQQDPTFWKQQTIKLGIPKKDIANFQEAGKLHSDLFSMETKSFPARGVNMFMEKQIRQKIPDLRMAREAYKRVADMSLERFKESYDENSKVVDYAHKGFIYTPPLKEMEEESEPVTNSHQLKSKASDEDSLVAGIRQEYPEFEKFTDEQVLEWALRNRK